MDSRRLLRTLVVVLSALAVAMGAAACGGDDDDEGGDRSDSAPAAAEKDRGEKAADGRSGEGGGKKTRGGDRAARDGGGSKGGGGGSRGSAPADQPLGLMGDKKEARNAADVTDGVYDAIRSMERTGGDKLIAGGGGEICDLMSEAARKQTIEYARRSSGLKEKWTCPKAVGLLVGRSQRVGGFGKTLKADVLGVNAEGDRATATIRFGKGPLRTVPLVREDGEWKLGASPATGDGK